MGDRTMPPPRGPVNPRKKFGVKPGFGMLDWNLLKTRARNLAGREDAHMRGITKAEVRKHNTQHDCWSIFRGKVYNLTPFLHYHPGGIPELMKGAGRDCTALFDKYHPWVNFDRLVGNLYLGPLKEDKKTQAEQDDGDSNEERKSNQEKTSNDSSSAEEKGKSGSVEMEGGSESVAAMGTGAVAETVTLGTLEQIAGAGKDALDQSE